MASTVRILTTRDFCALLVQLALKTPNLFLPHPDKQYYLADASARLYRTTAYYAAKQLAVLPFAVLNVLVGPYGWPRASPS